MKHIKTTSFRLAVYMKGDESSQNVAIVMPGTLDTKDYAHMKSHVDFLASQGFLALSFDPPGTWESDGSIELYTTTTYLQAVKELIAHFGKPTFLVGHSRGGSIALLAGTQIDDVYAFVNIMGKASREGETNSEWKEKKISSKKRDAPKGGELVFDLPYSYFEDGLLHNALPLLATCKKPKLFIAGAHDSTVSKEDVMLGFTQSADPKDYIELDSPHSYRDHPELVDEVNDVLRQFLENIH